MFHLHNSSLLRRKSFSRFIFNFLLYGRFSWHFLHCLGRQRIDNCDSGRKWSSIRRHICYSIIGGSIRHVPTNNMVWGIHNV